MKTNGYVLVAPFAVTLFALSGVSTSAFADAAPDSRAQLAQLAQAGAAPPAPPPAPPAAPPSPPPVAVAAPAFAGPTRDGFTIGFSLGVGELATSEDSLGGAGLSLRLGVALTPNLLLQAHLESIAADDSGARIYESFTGATLTAYLTPRFYLGGGLGRVSLSVNDASGREVGRSSSGGALLVLGVEIYQSPTFAVALESRGYFADFDGETVSAGGVSVGFQWF